MRRVVLWLLGTAVGTTLLVGVKAAPGMVPFSTVAQAPEQPAVDGSTGTGGQATPTGAPQPASAPARPGTPAPTGGRPTQGTAAPAPATRTILGNAYPAKDFGNVQVKVVMTGTHIDDIVVLRMSNRPLNAPSLLRQQALAKQSGAGLPNVSGATYTSRAYVQSLQSALAKA